MTGLREVRLDGSPAAVTVFADALRAALDGGGPAVLPMAAGPAADGLRRDLAPGEPVEPDTALVVATSGSTGPAKGVLLSGRALLASATATHERLGGPGRWLLALPAQHIAGAQVLVRSLLAGVDPVVLDLSSGFRPSAFAAATGARYTALVPTQLTRLLDHPAGAAALRGFDAVLLGGAAPPAGLLRRAAAAGVAVVTTYGMSETAGGCVYAGVPLTGVRFRLVDGLVELGGPTLAHGYRLRPDLTAAAFADGWFRTRDLGRRRADGGLEVLGRVDQVINTGGVKVAAAEVERVLGAAPGVADCCVVGLPDPEWGELVAAAVVPADPAERPDVDALRGVVRAELGAAAVPKLLRVVGALPVLGPGKVDRTAVRGLLTG